MSKCGRNTSTISKQLDERRTKIRDMIKERMQTATHILDEKQKKTGIEGRLEESEEQLKELIEYGDELVTNMRVAAEMREIERKNFEHLQKTALLDNLCDNSTETLAMFDNITDRWSELKQFKEPVAMFHQLQNQKQRIAELLASKDTIINKCQEEINRVSDKYYAEQESQAAEICSLVERIDNQVELMKKAYKHHLDLLQDAIEEERLKTSDFKKDRWEAVFEIMKTNEARKLEIEKGKEQFYIADLEKVCREQQELTRAIRIRLERDAEALEFELRNTQNNILMNSEKLDYNYQVLQKRNEENIIINNQQKRRVAKFKETIAVLKVKIQSLKTKSQASVTKLSEEVHKLYAHISELEQKSQEFLRANEKKYRYVWNLNYQEAISLLNRIYEIDRLLHEQQLGIPWSPQNIKGIVYNPVTRTTTGRAFMSEKSANHEEDGTTKKTTPEKPLTEQLAETRLLRSILKKISDRGGFLIEDKLIKILEPYTDEEKCLVRIDNIFNVLRITQISDVNALTKYFLPYSWCPNCSDGLFTDVVDELVGKVIEQNTQRGRPSLAEEIEKAMAEDTESSTETESCSVSFEDVDHGIDNLLIEKPKESQGEEKSSEQEKCKNHYLVIKPAFVLTALRNFTEKHLKRQHGSILGTFEKAIVRSSKVPKPVSKEAVEKFWSNLLNILPPEKQKLWKTLQHGLDHYLDILKEREKLDIECEFLRQQNVELRHLLQKSLPEFSENADLEKT